MKWLYKNWPKVQLLKLITLEVLKKKQLSLSATNN